MASSLDTVHYICDQAGLGTRLTFKRMFGEFGLYLDGKVVAFVCNDQLFLKPTAEGRQYLGTVTLAPPYPQAKDHFLLSADLDDPERLRGAIEVTASVLPEAKPRTTRSRVKASAAATETGRTDGKSKSKLRLKPKSKPKSKEVSKLKSGARTSVKKRRR